jgi:hypothetical protein
MNSANKKTGVALNRRDVLKLAGGALGLGALSYTAGLFNQAPPSLPAGDALPEYVDAGPGQPVFRGPYLQQQARMAAFLFPAGREQLSALCDRFLNLSPDAPYKYVPLLSSLVMIFTEMLVASLDERDRQVGLIPETELSFWLPLLALRKTGSGYLPDHPAWFLPWLFVDDGSAIATGREVYGFNKQQASFRKPEDPGDPQFVASVMGFKEYGPQARASLLPLVELKRSPGSSGAATPAWTGWPEAQSALAEGLSAQGGADPGAGWVDFAAQLVTERAPLVFLKQFRDAADTRRACYQALVEAPIKLKSFYEGGFLPANYELHINQLASHPLAAWLGLQSKPALAVRMSVDFTLGAGREVWKR